jgi:hypothetical protein
VARPYPTGTFTLQETPSFSWRENIGRQARREAEAKRKLYAVACTPMFGGWFSPQSGTMIWRVELP